jgi:hypothetical protein
MFVPGKFSSLFKHLRVRQRVFPRWEALALPRLRKLGREKLGNLFGVLISDEANLYNIVSFVIHKTCFSSLTMKLKKPE